MPPWPPEGFNFDAELSKLKCKRVTFDKWEVEDDVDEHGLRSWPRATRPEEEARKERIKIKAKN